MKDNFETIGHHDNCIIVKRSQRNYPGIMWQGDTVSVFLSQLTKIKELCEPGSEAQEEAEELEQTFKKTLLKYQIVLTKRGYDIPFTPIK